jgi:hypothetical protein
VATQCLSLPQGEPGWQNMSTYSEGTVAKLIANLPKMASKDVEVMRERASKNGVTDLLEACEAELKSGPIEFSKEAAESFEAMAEQVKDLDLYQAIGHAFTAVRHLARRNISYGGWRLIRVAPMTRPRKRTASAT